MEQTQRFWEAIAKIETVSSDITDIKDAVRELTRAVGKLSIIEERQLVANASLERAFKELERQSLRITTLELSQPLQQQATGWVNKAMWLVVGLVISAVSSGVLLSRPAAKAGEIPLLTMPSIHP